MFIVIFKDCTCVRKSDIDSAFSLPGKKYIFSTAGNLELNKPNGINYYNENRDIETFKINHLELIDIAKTSSNSPYTFSIYNHNTEEVEQIIHQPSHIDYALPEVIRELIRASNFLNWSDYKMVEQAQKHLQRIYELEEELKKCTKIINELQCEKKQSQD